MAPWKLPVIAAAIVVPIIAGFAIAGPGLGLAVAALVAFAIIWIAARQRPLGPIGAPAEDGRRHILLVTTCPVEEPSSVRRIAAAATLDSGDDADVLVLSPARIGFLDRWASDVEGARQVAQENLVATVAGLAKAGIVAEARVGDEDVVQAVEDQLQSFPANEVVLISGDGEEDDEDAAAELASRLRAEFRHVSLGGG
jgi:hypothetical protein